MRRLISVIAVISTILWMPAWSTQTAAADSSPTITEYPLSPNNVNPTSITTGSDGALWFLETNVNQLDRISTSGNITSYGIPILSQEGYAQPQQIVNGPDGALWITESGNNTIDRITTSGSSTEYPLPNANSGPEGITVGPDGALWFTETGTNTIGRITTDGAITEYPLSMGGVFPLFITTGSDGALWFTVGGGSDAYIGRITTSGAVTYFDLASAANPSSIIGGPDGALWFDISGAQDKIGRITTSGVANEYNLNSQSPGPDGITVGPDGALWFGEPNTNQIGRITTSGSVTDYTVPTSGSAVRNITTGPNGALWFTESNGNKVGQLVPPVTSSPVITSPTTATVNARNLANVTVTTTGNPTATLTESGTLPTGLTFADNGNGTGTISGQASPVNNGLYLLTFTATNSAGSTTQQFYLSVNNAQTAPTFVSAASATESYGTPFSFPVDTTGNPVPNIKRDSSGGSFPTGVSIHDNNDGTASLNGTGNARLARGTYTFTLQAKNKNGLVTENFTLTIQ